MLGQEMSLFPGNLVTQFKKQWMNFVLSPLLT